MRVGSVKQRDKMGGSESKRALAMAVGEPHGWGKARNEGPHGAARATRTQTRWISGAHASGTLAPSLWRAGGIESFSPPTGAEASAAPVHRPERRSTGGRGVGTLRKEEGDVRDEESLALPSPKLREPTAASAVVLCSGHLHFERLPAMIGDQPGRSAVS
ncbi:hypothetical protein HPB50_007699 [Hyalomma asiaticum]|uniref:Uncharacterized protein n=1 Tax=Hyalomma asiaticum TaxID=266040 RepID=A0ACB7TEB1_HYAAI|nr:hypothetical protein HPB50_007699 [Hyalomma asiaticum]